MIEMSSAWRDDSQGANCSNPFSATGESYKPRSQRQIGCRATSSSGSREMLVDRETQMTITRREILHRVPQRLKLTEQQSWQNIAQSKGTNYLQRLPEAIPEGQFLVHNSVRPTHPLRNRAGGVAALAQQSGLLPHDREDRPRLPPVALYHTFELGAPIRRLAQTIDDEVFDPVRVMVPSQAPIDSDRPSC